MHLEPLLTEAVVSLVEVIESLYIMQILRAGVFVRL